MSGSDATKVLDDLMTTLEQAEKQSDGGKGDAIDAVLAGTPRSTQVASVRQAPEMEAFRRELVDGLIRADTVNQVLRLLNEWVTAGLLR
jgi:hypothetical protein